jgi:hypothetical protein
MFGDKLISELKDVLIGVAFKPKVHQVLDIFMVAILEAHCLFLNEDWSRKL